MKDIELTEIWKSYDQKLNKTFSLNNQLVEEITMLKVINLLKKLKAPKRRAILIGVPYILFLFFLAFIGYKANAPFVMIGFGSIAVFMIIVMAFYIYQIHLINKIDNNQSIIETQKRISNLKVSSFNTLRITILQIPFWIICWISFDTLKNSPFLYGGINLILFIGFSYFIYLIYKKINISNLNSKVNKFLFSGYEWKTLIESSKLLKELNQYETEIE